MEEKTDALDRAEQLIEQGDNYSAQQILSNIEEESGRKCYLQSRIYKSECWYNEQRKQLKKAVKLEPDNQLYQKELDELTEFRKTAEYKDTLQRPKRAQMGMTDMTWTDCCAEFFCYCLCEGICEGLSNCN